ncbi:aromatic amino acid lyase [Rhodococcus sp. KBW08]|uniref:aromatic amino acid lyase n=1 Tax=Rhodococcus sp. KBW08 TaxID=2144188 RepID=UPI000F5B14A2|nr:aromatic amino acid lyase [Rhodococcus sp. KBW08]
MTVIVDTATDLTLDTLERVTRGGEDCELSPAAIVRIDERRAQFLRYVDAHSDKHLYGITTKHHVGAKSVLGEDSRAEFATRLPSTPATGGPALPDHLVRAIILARLTDVLNGTACLRSETATRLLGLLRHPQLPPVPSRGNGEPGDIVPLGHLLRAEFNGTLQLGEGMALINGSPVATAALVDAVLDSKQRIIAVEQVMALAALAIRAPAAHYAQELEVLWRDEHQATTLSNFRRLVEHDAHSEELPYQAPVSFRSAPRVVGWSRRTLAAAEECAEIALAASSNNPVFVGPGTVPPLGAILSNGGYHNALVAPTLDSLARSWADISQLVTAQVNRLVEDPTGLAATEPESQVGLFYMTSAGWAEESRAAATPSLIGIGGAGQTDTGTPDLLAWRKAQEAGTALDNNLSLLAVVAAHTLARTDRPVAPASVQTYRAILDRFPVGTDPIDFAVRLQSITDALTTQLIKTDQDLTEPNTTRTVEPSH